MIHLTRRYRFSASHRLHNEALSAEENRRLYGKCDNLFGHGHNYVLDVTMAGPVEPETGMVFDLAELDRTVEREVLERFDTTNLNLDDKTFRNVVPTTENLCVEIYQTLESKLAGRERWPAARLERVRLEETNSNYFEYAGGGDGRLDGRRLG
jgi:6-pyruvoyltetrahydropterin/6-carboxytetrahydropterin synthase